MTANDFMKYLFINKTIATLNRYQSGQIFYRFKVEEDTYELPISVVTEILNLNDEVDSIELSDDLGTTAFLSEVRASELMRWIKPIVMTTGLKKII